MKKPSKFKVMWRPDANARWRVYGWHKPIETRAEAQCVAAMLQTRFPSYAYKVVRRLPPVPAREPFVWSVADKRRLAPGATLDYYGPDRRWRKAVRIEVSHENWTTTQLKAWVRGDRIRINYADCDPASWKPYVEEPAEKPSKPVRDGVIAAKAEALVANASEGGRVREPSGNVSRKDFRALRAALRLAHAPSHGFGIGEVVQLGLSGATAPDQWASTGVILKVGAFDPDFPFRESLFIQLPYPASRHRGSGGYWFSRSIRDVPGAYGWKARYVARNRELGILPVPPDQAKARHECSPGCERSSVSPLYVGAATPRAKPTRAASLKRFVDGPGYVGQLFEYSTPREEESSKKPDLIQELCDAVEAAGLTLTLDGVAISARQLREVAETRTRERFAGALVSGVTGLPVKAVSRGRAK